MQPSIDKQPPSSEVDVALRELGSSIKFSLRSTTHEALPAEIGLLLLRLALAEVLKKAAEDEARESGLESFPNEWFRALRQSIGHGFASIVG
jgi:hypothetical protein